jgi:DNA invertase Pin-like site-specific DNA recombinase
MPPAPSKTSANATSSLGGSTHDTIDPVGKPLFNVLTMVAEFESDLISALTLTLTLEGMQITKDEGKLRIKQPKPSRPRKNLIPFHHGGQLPSADITELFGVARSTVYRIVQRSGQNT